MAIPALRALQPIPFRTPQGERGFFLKDPLELSDEPCVLTPAGMLIAGFLDGRRDAAAVERAIERHGAGRAPRPVIEAVVAILDRHHLLDNDRARRAEARVVEAFRAAPDRPPAFAGTSYPADAAAAGEFLDRLIEAAPPPDGDRPLALIAPHIDLAWGGPAMATVYRSLEGLDAIDRVVVLGVGHQARGLTPYVATRKDFRTPLGTVPTSVDFLDALAADLPFDPYQDETAHRREHSIEFQVLFLQRVLSRPFEIVPILCGSFAAAIAAGRSPEDVDGRVAAFVESLRRSLEAAGDRVLLVAGVDLAHVGPKFGGPRPADGDHLAEVEAADRRMLATVVDGDAAAFHGFVAAEGDSRNVCGHSAIYTLLRTLEPRRPRARLLAYDRCVEAETASAVTFAGLRLEATA